MNNYLKAMKPLFVAYVIDFFCWLYLLIVLYSIFTINLLNPFIVSHLTIWHKIFVLISLSVIIPLLLLPIKGWSIGKRTANLHTATNRKFWCQPYNVLIGILILATLTIGYYVTEISFEELFSRSGLLGARRIFLAILSPEFSIFNKAILAAIETVYIALIATLIAAPFAFIISFLASKNLMKNNCIEKLGYFFIRTILNITRSVEPLIWAIIFSVWVGIGPFAGMLALMLHSISSLAKLFSEQIENIDTSLMEAIKSTGAHPIQVVWFGVVPQVFLPFLSFLIYRWDINLRMATIIGLVGGGGIGTMLIQYQGLGKWHEVGTILIIITVIVSTLDYLSTVLRRKFNP